MLKAAVDIRRSPSAKKRFCLLFIVVVSVAFMAIFSPSSLGRLSSDRIPPRVDLQNVLSAELPGAIPADASLDAKRTPSGELPSSFDIAVRSGAKDLVPESTVRRASELASMPLLTIVSVPKPFVGSAAANQLNALRSWSQLVPPPQILLCGRAEGTEDIVKSIRGAVHVPDVVVNAYGMPRLDGVFAAADTLGLGQVVVFINCDLILTNEVVTAVLKVQSQLLRFLIIGRRIEVPRPIDVTDNQSQWLPDVRLATQTFGLLAPESWLDYFIFSRGLFREVPPLAIGRAFVDRWIVNATYAMDGVGVVDASGVVLPLHQSHTYDHLAGGRNDSMNFGSRRQGWLDEPDTLDNCNIVLRLAGEPPIERFDQIDWDHLSELLRFGRTSTVPWVLEYDAEAPLHLRIAVNPRAPLSVRGARRRSRTRLHQPEKQS